MYELLSQSFLFLFFVCLLPFPFKQGSGESVTEKESVVGLTVNRTRVTGTKM
jgi:hypothetical protein